MIINTGETTIRLRSSLDLNGPHRTQMMGDFPILLFLPLYGLHQLHLRLISRSHLHHLHHVQQSALLLKRARRSLSWPKTFIGDLEVVEDPVRGQVIKIEQVTKHHQQCRWLNLHSDAEDIISQSRCRQLVFHPDKS